MNEKKVKEALAVLEHAECDGGACPGPDRRFVHMATCNTCRGIQLLRRAVK